MTEGAGSAFAGSTDNAVAAGALEAFATGVNCSGLAEAISITLDGLTFNVFTMTGRIGSVEPGFAAAIAGNATVAERSVIAGALFVLALAKVKRSGSFPADFAVGWRAGLIACAVCVPLDLGGVSATAGALCLSDALLM
jgi:hypothetical protein